MTTLDVLEPYQPLRDESGAAAGNSGKIMASAMNNFHHRPTTAPRRTSSTASLGSYYNNNTNAAAEETSNNVQNRAMMMSSASTASRQQQPPPPSSSSRDDNSSTLVRTGSGGRRSSMNSHKTAGGSSTAAATTRNTNNNDQQHHHHNNHNSSSESGVEKVIEEKRKRANGADGYTIHKYTLGRLLGKGGFAKVYLCTAMDTGKHYAVKVVPKANLTKARARQKLQAEIKIHRMLKHKYVCQYKHYFEDRKNCYILLELCHNQSLNEMIKRRKRLTEPEAAYFMRQLLEATRYMHSVNVIHRDLKLGNLFLDKDMNMKVGDLGLATQVEDKDEKRKTICGTPNYIAPEIIQGDKAKRGHSFEVDVWSMGVILFTVLVGKPPYEAKDVKATYQRILNNEYNFPRHIDISNYVKNIIQSMLQSHPKDRPTLDEIENHPFLAESTIPTYLPTSTLSMAPIWRMNEYGELVCTTDKDSSISSSKVSSIPRSNSLRQPFASRDPNLHKGAASTTIASSTTTKSRKEARDVVNMERVVKAALTAMTGGCTSAKATATTMSSSSGAAAPQFRIFDEAASRANPKPPPATIMTEEPRDVAGTSRPKSSNTEDALVQQTRALTIEDSNLQQTAPVAPNAFATQSAVKKPENDAEVLQHMADHLDAVINITTTRKGSYRSTPVRPLTSRRGPSKWVTRYVDYTSKYGLGFLLNDGSSGVYFNDSTKTALEKGGEDFLYVERKKVAEGKRRGETVMETHNLEKYPETLKKKVTLLKHFRDYLMQQEMGQEDDCDDHNNNNHGDSVSTGLVYVKKWVRTKHAILFSLSDRTVQVIFYDQTEILLTPDVASLTYVDKQRRRLTYHFTDELVGTSAEIEKRLKYTKEILLQLLSGTTTSTKC